MFPPSYTIIILLLDPYMIYSTQAFYLLAKIFISEFWLITVLEVFFNVLPIKIENTVS